MDKKPIRVRYSGFIIFASQIISVITGLVFTLLLTRNMTTAEFGVWSFIFYLANFFILVNGLFPFWATRFLARGKEGATKTALVANLVTASVSLVIYLAVLAPVMNFLGIPNMYLFIYALASLQILNMFLIAVFEGALQATKPQVRGYGLLIEEGVKVALAFVLIIGLKQLFLGALVSILAAAAVQVAFYAWILKDEFKQAIRWNYLREWLKGSTVYVYNIVGTQIGSLLLYMLLFFGGEVALGDYQAAVTFSTVIGYASALTISLYPKMLAQECPEDISASLNTIIMLALPMATVALTMSSSLLIILNESYAVAAPILMLLTVDALIVLISQFYTQCLMGVEAFDAEGKIPFRQLLRSKIFKVFTLPYIQAAIALPSLYVILAGIGFANPEQAAMYLIMINIASHSIVFAAVYALMRRSLTIHVAWRSIGKYIFGAVVAAVILLVLPQTTTLTTTFGKILVGAAVYAGILYAIDADARKLVGQILNEIRGALTPKAQSANL